MGNKNIIELTVHFFQKERIFYHINMIINNMVIIIQLNNLILGVMMQIILILQIINLKVHKVRNINRDFLNYLVIKVSFSLEGSVSMKILKKK